MADSPIEILSGQALRIGGTTVGVAPRPGGGFMVGTVAVRPLPLGERAQLLSLVDDGSPIAELAERVADMIGTAARTAEDATEPASAPRSHLASEIVDAIALHLAGASGQGALRQTELVAHRALGVHEASRLTAIDADQLTAGLLDGLQHAAPAPTAADDGWTTITFADGAEHSPDVDGTVTMNPAAVRLELARRLVERHRAAIDPELALLALSIEDPSTVPADARHHAVATPGHDGPMPSADAWPAPHTAPSHAAPPHSIERREQSVTHTDRWAPQPEPAPDPRTTLPDEAGPAASREAARPLPDRGSQAARVLPPAPTSSSHVAPGSSADATKARAEAAAQSAPHRWARRQIAVHPEGSRGSGSERHIGVPESANGVGGSAPGTEPVRGRTRTSPSGPLRPARRVPETTGPMAESPAPRAASSNSDRRGPTSGTPARHADSATLATALHRAADLRGVPR